jgi:ubiquitin C-terminal hydrolase
VVQTDEGIVQFSLDPVVKKPITRGKGAGVNVQAKSLTTYFEDMTFCNYPQLLLIFPEHQTQVETMGKKSTQASHQELRFKEVITLKPHADNIDQQEVSYTLIAFTVFSESCGCGHYKVYCKKGDTEWYLFHDDKTTKKHGEIALINTKKNIVT